MFWSRKTSAAGTFSAHTRRGFIRRLQRETFDIVIVGGGITGAAIARDAVMRGLSVALLEKGDFAVGTSSRSSKMVHGGLRYLKGGHVRLVRESLQERGRLLRLAPHLVRPIPFLMPVYEGSSNSKLKLRLGLTAYDLLAGSLGIARHAQLSLKQILTEEPLLRRDGLKGGFRFYDCLVNDARLTLAHVRSAAKLGAVTVNYVEANGVIRDGERVTGVHFRDGRDGREGVVRGRAVVNATGPWCDQVRGMSGLAPMLRPTKGVHLVFARSQLPISKTTIIFRGDRVIFAIPYGDTSYVGTTDTDYQGDPTAVDVDGDDVSYLLDAINDQFETLQLTPADVMSSWAGVRPLIAEEGAETPSDVSRDYIIETEPEGMYSITGGKLTTCRAMAETLVDRVVEQEGRHFGWTVGRSRTATVPLIGGEAGNFEKYAAGAMPALVEQWRLEQETAQRLLKLYGTEHVRVLAMGLRDRKLLQPLAPDCPVLRAEALYAAEEEMALTLEDFMLRRSELMLFDHDHGLDASEEAARLIGDVIGWGRAQRKREVSSYHEAVARMTSFSRPSSERKE